MCNCPKFLNSDTSAPKTQTLSYNTTYKYINISPIRLNRLVSSTFVFTCVHMYVCVCFMKCSMKEKEKRCYQKRKNNYKKI